jgi:hypothetical protein
VPAFDDPNGFDEDDYISRIIPPGGDDLWNRSIDVSPVWDGMSPERHAEIADLFAHAVYSGSIYEAERFTDELDIVWDNDDISDYWDLYDMSAH